MYDDGDVLNLIAVFSKRYIDMFEPFYPYNFITDSDSGEFSHKYIPTKDVSLGLKVLLG